MKRLKKRFQNLYWQQFLLTAGMVMLTLLLLGVSFYTLSYRYTMQEKRGENFVDSGIKILIAVVIGALLLGGLYALFGDTIMPTVTEKVEDMFDFNG